MKAVLNVAYFKSCLAQVKHVALLVQLKNQATSIRKSLSVTFRPYTFMHS